MLWLIQIFATERSRPTSDDGLIEGHAICDCLHTAVPLRLRKLIEFDTCQQTIGKLLFVKLGIAGHLG